MHNIFESPKRAIVSAVGGIYISIAVTSKYNIPELTEQELAQNKISIAMLDFHKWMNGYSLTSLIVALFFTYLFWKSFDSGKKLLKSKLSIFISLVFGVLNTAGLYMFYLDRLPISIGGVATLYMLFVVIGWACAFFLVATWVLKLFEHIELQTRKTYQLKNRIFEYYSKHIFICSFCVILIAWMIWVIAYYPASMDWDVFRQLNSYLGRNGGYPSNHDPWFSSCVLGIFYKIGLKIGSENIGIFLYVLCRDVAMALIYAKGIEVLKKHRVNIYICSAVLMFYAITPVWGAYAKHAFKDTFAAALFCWFILNTICIVEEISSNKLTWQRCVFYSFSVIIVSLFRNNCIYAAAPVTVLVLIYMLSKKKRLQYIFIVFLSLLIYFGYNKYIVAFDGVKPGSSVEAFSIPFQQTARTVKKHEKSITKEEKKAISKVLDYDSLVTNYDPILSDPVKDRSSYEICSGEERRKYFITWAKMFFKYPITYIEAALGQSYGYYAFTPNLPDRAGNYNSGMTIFDWIGSGNSEGYNVHYIDKFSGIREVLNTWSKIWDEIPGVNLVDMCAFYTWMIVFLGIYLIYRGKWEKLIPVVGMMIIILTCMASPVNDCFRYYSPVAASFPMLIMLLGRTNAKKVKRRR